MAPCASSDTVEHIPTASRCRLVEASFGWRGRGQTQLILQQSGEFRRHEIWRLRDANPNPGVGETAVPAHLRHANIVVPVGNRTIASIRLEPDAFQAEGGRKDDGEREAVQ